MLADIRYENEVVLTLGSILSQNRNETFMKEESVCVCVCVCVRVCVCVYLCVSWKCAAGCALPGRGVWPPPPRPPEVSSYSSFPSSGASGSELNGREDEEEEEEKEEGGCQKRLHSNYSFIVQMIVLYGLPVPQPSWIFT